MFELCKGSELRVVFKLRRVFIIPTDCEIRKVCEQSLFNFSGQQIMVARSGTLYVVATPIGNLDDFTHRAAEVLGSVDCIYAEDTRHSRTLLQRYDISSQLQSLHEHNESGRKSEVLARLQAGESVALISDAGTPLVSDPGYRVVAHCIEAGIKVSPVPGPSALLAALCVSGQSVDTFVYCGFPPSKQHARADFFDALKAERRTMVFFESRHRIEATLATICEQFGGERSLTVARELTKRFETINRLPAQQHLERLRSGEQSAKGEFVLVLAGSRGASASDADAETQELRRVLGILLVQLGTRAAADCAASITGSRKNLAYQTALDMANGSADG